MSLSIPPPRPRLRRIREALAGLAHIPSETGHGGPYFAGSFIRTVGVPAALAFALLHSWQGSLEEERTMRREQHSEMVVALKAVGSRADETTRALETVASRADEMRPMASWLQGVVAGRLKCPDLSCPRCPPCPNVVVNNPPPPAPPVPRPPILPPATLPQPALPTPRRER